MAYIKGLDDRKPTHKSVREILNPLINLPTEFAPEKVDDPTLSCQPDYPPQSDAGAELNGHSRTHYLRWNKGKLEQRWISCYQGVEDLWIEIEDIATVALKKGE